MIPALPGKAGRKKVLNRNAVQDILRNRLDGKI
jgi:hypothetical protein